MIISSLLSMLLQQDESHFFALSMRRLTHASYSFARNDCTRPLKLIAEYLSSDEKERRATKAAHRRRSSSEIDSIDLAICSLHEKRKEVVNEAFIGLCLRTGGRTYGASLLDPSWDTI